MFRPVESSVSFPKLEQRTIEFWNKHEIYEKSLAARAGAPEFVFYEGPPTANGLPHPGHCLTRAIKDLFPRYQTMRGKLCRRKAGWDTHGLPVEVEVCKELGIHSKEEIEEYGVEPFIHKCLESVFRYTKQWEQMTERLGFWIHLDEAYVTYHQSYVESVWWALKNLFDRGLLYQGHKIVWWWAQGGTALSSGEVGQGYREVADPSVYVRFPLVDDDHPSLRKFGLTGADLLVWTTTPWTLPSNQFVAVNMNIEYSVVSFEGEERKLVMASALVETIAAKAKKEFTAKKLSGKELVGLRYMPPFDCYYKSQGQTQGQWKAGIQRHVAWRVINAYFVNLDSGTGVVHQAPAFGEVDYDVLTAEQNKFKDGQGPKLICAVGSDGKFTEEFPEYKGRWVKESDRDICRQLRAEGKLFHQEQYLHEYPFCWRADEDPLIQYPRKSWFIRTTNFRDELMANNKQINWLPAHIRDGRMGNFLESNVDWALSRERYWGTPLPIWVCEETGYKEAVANYDELLAKPGIAGTEAWDEAKAAKPGLPEDLKVHKPYIDNVTYDSPKAPGARMRRVSEVIDCWFDSGAMPFAQWGYPATKGSREQFNSQFPADFISEALDQTRGWFYSQLAISTLLFGKDAAPKDTQENTRKEYPHPFRNCIVLGLMLGEDGQKMSKSKRNYREPGEVFDRYGADALRWYLFANQPPWTSIRYSEQSIKECIPEFLLRLWNCYSFFVIYANIDKFDPGEAISRGSILEDGGQLTPAVLKTAKGFSPLSERRQMDRWVISELNRATAAVTEAMDAYDNYGACCRLNEFVDLLSNWYVRRGRARFWSNEISQSKTDAYWTLYECLIAVTKLIAPFVPFLAEELWQNLAVQPFTAEDGTCSAVESVHLCDYPTVDPTAINEFLSQRMSLAREIISLGRGARMNAKLRVRQPLSCVEVVLSDDKHQAWLEEHGAIIRDELNVKELCFAEKADQYITYNVLPDLKRLGPKIGRQVPALKKALAQADGGRLLAQLEADGQITIELPDGPVTLDGDDIKVRLNAKEGWTAAQGRQCVVVLSTELTDDLIAEGLAREVVRVVQDRRKEMDCEYTDRIHIGLVTESEELRAAIEQFKEYVTRETLAVELGFEPIAGAESVEVKPAGNAVELFVEIRG